MNDGRHPPVPFLGSPACVVFFFVHTVRFLICAVVVLVRLLHLLSCVGFDVSRPRKRGTPTNAFLRREKAPTPALVGAGESSNGLVVCVRMADVWGGFSGLSPQSCSEVASFFRRDLPHPDGDVCLGGPSLKERRRRSRRPPLNACRPSAPLLDASPHASGGTRGKFSFFLARVLVGL